MKRYIDALIPSYVNMKGSLSQPRGVIGGYFDIDVWANFVSDPFQQNVYEVRYITGICMTRDCLIEHDWVESLKRLDR